MTPVTDLQELLRHMTPVLNPGTFVFASLPGGRVPESLAVLASVREAEGLSVVLTEAEAQRHGIPVVLRCAWITLMVQSDLSAVGLTAAFAGALAAAGLSCNVVAGAHHDHLFVPLDSAPRALEVLQALQARATATHI